MTGGRDASGREWEQKVVVGSTLELGQETFRVHAIAPGSESPGSVTLVRVSP